MNARRFWPLLSALLPGLLPGGAWAQQPFGNNKAPGVSQEAFVRMVRHNDGSRTVTSKHAGNATGMEVDQHIQLVQTYDKDGDLKLERRYHLNSGGQPQTFEIYNGFKKPLLRGKFVYDSFGRMQEESLYSMDNRIIRKLSQSYDYSGNKLTPTVENFEALPPDILYWMDPDSAPASVKAAMAAASAGPKGSSGGTGEKRGIFSKIFGKK